MRAHAILSPSGASKWLTCTPSARLEAQFPESKSTYADEGTLAHSLGELMISHKLKKITKHQYNKLLKDIEASSYYCPEMHEHAENYAVFVMERYADALSHTKDAMIFLEKQLDMTDYVPEGFGTGDVVIIADGTLELIDLKYGKGVSVSATNNKQMKLYGLGALRDFDFIYDIHTVRMTIYQPRIDNFSTWELPVVDLKQWAEDELRQKAQLAFDGEGEFVPGDHCRFCKAKAVCRAFADMNLGLARYDFADPAVLNDEEIADIISRADTFKNWISSIEEHALAESINNGKKWPGYKLVEGRSNRKYSDEEAVAQTLASYGYGDDVIYKRSLLTITEMEKKLGKKTFGEYLGELIIKPQGKPTLVPLTDKRPEYSSTESAVNDFINA